MANPEHVEILKRGGEVWNQWREENSDVVPDLSEVNMNSAYLRLARLDEANVSGANFLKADLWGANLECANLFGANFHKANLLEANFKGANIREANLRAANISETNIGGADLYKANLREANLCNSNLSHANLYEADLRRANLRKVELEETDLTRADLSGADFILANIKHAEFFLANLYGVDFIESNITKAKFHLSNLDKAIFGFTVLSNVLFKETKCLNTTIHKGPSTLGIDTLYISQGNIPDAFLRGCGVPDQMIEYAKSLTGSPIEYYSCFISYSSKDEEFARRVHNDLQAAGVRCWFAPHDLKIGDKIRSTIDDSIRIHDKLLLILSEHSVESDWVEHEVEHALDLEKERKKNVLFPVRVDEAVMESKTGWAGNVRRQRHIGDFTRWKDHDAYSKAFDRLLQDLKAG